MPKFKNFAATKGKLDAKKNNQFVKMGRQIIVEARNGGADPNANLKLKALIQKAKQMQMPGDNIERAIKKGAGNSDADELISIRYEGYGVGGVAVMVSCLTDNRNRTGAEVRAAFNKRGGAMGEPNCVAWMFDEKGVLVIEKDEDFDMDEDTVMMAALEAGAEDVSFDEESIEILTEPSEFDAVKAALEEQGFTFVSAEVAMVPKNTVTVTGDDAANMLKMLDTLEDNDDVQNVYTNMDIPEEELAKLGR